jgi:hypothetical protein
MPAKTRPNDVDPYAAACEYWLREPKNRIWKRVAKEMELQTHCSCGTACWQRVAVSNARNGTGACTLVSAARGGGR